MKDMIAIVGCVDDTDDVTKETSTGAVAHAIVAAADALGAVVDLGITRHQLLLHEDVPYTSHNSSMAFSFNLPPDVLDDWIAAVEEAIVSMSADAADPGFCWAVLPRDDYDEQLHELIHFGQAAKTRVLAKADAYALADSIPWISLDEYGGTGQGVIGALAGVGLRLSGCDGRFRGSWDMDYRKRDEFVLVNLEGARIASDIPIAKGSFAKPVLYGGACAVVAQVRDGVAYPLDKDALEGLERGFADMNRSCSQFELDNDLEEVVTAVAIAACPNCLYRRWLDTGFVCMKEGLRAYAE